MIPNSSTTRPRIVLDTNVCLDLFVFNDPRWGALLNALRQQRIEAITQKSCRDEWLRVLHYRGLPITDDNRPDIIRRFDEHIVCICPDVKSTIKLPRCSDPDDQQFMELARDGGATHLITKDKALLKCAKKVAQSRLFSIVPPEQFLKSNHHALS